ncbi:MAG: beta-glucuronidase [Clostridia bacterium]|nr:beta-glucuronidase [Clostridia bacterium]
MARLFDDHKKRKVQCLDGIWNFKIDPQNVGESERWFDKLETENISAVPSMWNIEKGLLEYEGLAWYQRDFYTEGGTLKLSFDGVMTKADVWLDGDYIGSHYGGFSHFEFIVTSVAAGSHRLTVRADNRFDKQSIPQVWVDWYHYGGITRSICAETIQGICVLANKLEYSLNDGLTAAEYRFVSQLYNAEDKSVTSKVEFALDGKIVYAEDVTLASGEYRELITPTATLDNVRLWSCESPALYDISIVTDTDDLIDRTGFRLIEVKDNKILLNGKSLELRGVNRHEEHPEFGFAFPQSLMKRDIDIILDMGCNTIRGSHYPNSKLFLDMLDKYGILFWSEIPIWGCGFSEAALADEVVLSRGLEMHREMIEQYYNHPSIIFWGMHNEIHSDTQAGYEMSRRYYNFLKENGGNRIVTYASNVPMTDISFEFCDVISLNMYYGWYGGTKEDWDSFLTKFRARRDSLGFAHKPVIMSEFGCAALYGNHTFDNIPWSEEYQAELLSYAINAFHKDDMMVGFYVWQYCDMRTCKPAGINRARGFNNKGIVNEYRKPKAAYFAVSKDYHNFIAEEKK